MNKNESKYFYTASLMDEALIELLHKKEFEYITVKELCQKAGVNRSTFYLHYETMNDLLEETVEYVNKRFLSSLEIPHEKSELTTTVLTTEKFLRPYLLFIKNNLSVYKLIHKKGHLFKIYKTYDKLNNSIFDEALTNFKVKDGEKKYVISFYMGGTYSIIKKWIEGNCMDDIDFIIDLITTHTKVIK